MRKQGLLLVILCVLCACSDGIRIEPLPRDAVVLAFGDSLTAGVGATNGNSFPQVLARLSGLDVVNAGVSGETTDRGRARLPGALDQHAPQLLILLEGGNDILRNRNPTDVRANLEAMIRESQSRSIPVVFIGVPAKSLFSNAAPFYDELAEQYGLAYDGRILGKLLRDASMKSDQIHFNDEGYRELAEAIHRLLEDVGAL